MCQSLTALEDRENGELYRLCGKPLRCLLNLIKAAPPIENEDGTALMPGSWTPARKLLLAISHEAKTVLVENNYFDVDYRSEIAVMQESAFLPALPETRRLHFFGKAVDPKAKTVRLFDYVQSVADAIRETEQAAVAKAQADAEAAAERRRTKEADSAGDAEDNEVDDAATDAEASPEARRRSLNPHHLYHGYIVIRPRFERQIGRSMVAPYTPIIRDLDELDAQYVPEEKAADAKSSSGPTTAQLPAAGDGSASAAQTSAPRARSPIPAWTVEGQVRTAVMEQVNLFGVYLKVIGVPFMEQDGALLRCAHVSAWICHYAALLRGAVARRPTAHFYRSGEGDQAIGRQFPGAGVSTAEITSILRKSNLAPEVLSKSALLSERDPTWADRPELSKNLARLNSLHEEAVRAFEDGKVKYATPEGADSSEGAANLYRLSDLQRRAKDARDELDMAWAKENLSSNICRYLNSGIPVMLIRKRKNHTQVVVGYLRESDLPENEQAGKAQSEVVQFIASDDQDGPFELVDVDELVRGLVFHGDLEVAVPLPYSLWLSGDSAEKVAIKVLEQQVDERRDNAKNWEALTPDARKRAEKALTTFSTQLAQRKYTVRTYSTTGVDFKDSIRSRIRHPGTIRRIMSTQLPKYVWVVEAISRDRRKSGKPTSVRAMAVLDASIAVPTQDADDKSPVRSVDPIVMLLPGQVKIKKYAVEQRHQDDDEDEGTQTGGAKPASKVDDEETRTAENRGWEPGSYDLFSTGRWSHERLWAQSLERNANQAKAAASR